MDDNIVELVKQSDPTGRKLGEPGAKMDAGKPDLLTSLRQFPNALAALSDVSIYGAETKGYGWNAWKLVPKGEERYRQACVRHISTADFDDESGLAHAAHAAWNALAVRECEMKRRKKVDK